MKSVRPSSDQTQGSLPVLVRVSSPHFIAVYHFFPTVQLCESAVVAYATGYHHNAVLWCLFPEKPKLRTVLDLVECFSSALHKLTGLGVTGDSYGPSPVSGGAPSPPVMIEGPRRPPSAPVGRKIDPYGELHPQS